METQMATVQVDGTSSVTTTSTDNNGGTIKANGAVSGTFSASSVTQSKTGVFGSTVVDNDSADKALSAGTFAFDNNSPVAKKITTSLSGVSNTVLLSGAGNPGGIRSIHKIESIETLKLTTAIRENRYNEFSGEFDAGYPELSTDNFGSDDAANPTRSVPGELVYRTGAKEPVTDEYKAKTN
jgi:hypothetical protein